MMSGLRSFRTAFALTAFLAVLTLACHETAAPPNAQGPTPSDTTPPPAALVTGDTLLGTVTADTPRFVRPYRAADSAWFTIFVQADYGQMTLTVTDSATSHLVARALVSPASGTSLLNSRCDDFVTLPGHTYLANVQANALGDTGRFRLLLAPVDRRPEHHAAGIAEGDTVTGETLSNSADIDDFTFTGAAGDLVDVFFDPVDSLVPNSVRAAVVRNADDSVLGVVANERSGADDSVSTGRLTLPVGGSYRVTIYELVAPPSPLWTFAGSYQFNLYHVNPLPETAAAQLVPGDTVEGERIDRVGDLDTYSFAGNAGDQFVLALQATGDTTAKILAEAGPNLSYITNPTQSPRLVVGNDGLPLAQHIAGPFALPSAGTYQIQVQGDTARTTALNRGPYRLFLYRVDPAPETAPASLAIGDSIVDETIAFPGDVDRFTLTGSPGQMVEILVSGRTPQVPGAVEVSAIDPANDSLLRAHVASSPPDVLGRVTMPAGGALRLEATSDLNYYGPYAVHTVAIDSAPEIVPSAYTVGDTVTAETIAPVGDVDDFTFNAAAGDTLDLYASAAAFAGGWVRFVLTGGNGVRLIDFQLNSANSPWTFHSVALGAQGPFRLRVSGASDQTGTGPYAFAVIAR